MSRNALLCSCNLPLCVSGKGSSHSSAAAHTIGDVTLYQTHNLYSVLILWQALRQGGFQGFWKPPLESGQHLIINIMGGIQCTQRRLVTILNFYRTHIPDDVSTYSFCSYINYDLLTQRVELGWSGHVLRDWRSAMHIIMWPTSSAMRTCRTV